MDAGAAEGLKRLHTTLERYAGWLDRQRSSMMVQADIKALGIAIDTCVDPLPLLLTLDTNLARLPSGNVRKMLRVAAGALRRELAGAR